VPSNTYAILDRSVTAAAPVVEELVALSLLGTRLLR